MQLQKRVVSKVVDSFTKLLFIRLCPFCSPRPQHVPVNKQCKYKLKFKQLNYFSELTNNDFAIAYQPTRRQLPHLFSFIYLFLFCCHRPQSQQAVHMKISKYKLTSILISILDLPKMTLPLHVRQLDNNYHTFSPKHCLSKQKNVSIEIDNQMREEKRRGEERNTTR